MIVYTKISRFSQCATVFFILLYAGCGMGGKPNRVSPEMKPVYNYLTAANARIAGQSRAEFESDLTFLDAKGNRISLLGSAADAPSWALLDPAQDKTEGTSTERLYREYQLKAPEQPVVVAVIDGGVDVNHEDLKDLIWTNERERDGTPGVDNDGNGYVDDVNGWNFLGNVNGKNVTTTSLEVARELSRLLKKEASEGLSESERIYLERVRKDYRDRSDGYRAGYEKVHARYLELDTALEVLRKQGLKEESSSAVSAIESNDPVVLEAKELALKYLKEGVTTAKLKKSMEWFRGPLDTYFNLDLNPSAIIGDDPERMDELGYGNPDVKTETAAHGTHVSGIIGALRENGIGMNGQANYIRIMAIRAVPDGDERDKDVANGVRYAVDNGARIINMSFGKGYSPNQDYVEAAMRYAEAKGVLLVHAAGNDGQDIDVAPHFPVKPASAGHWIEVGASSEKKGDYLAASFSNYGQKTVDLFAPGEDIYSAIPGNGYMPMSGTSMAAPEVAGVAALILSQFPFLSASELRGLLMETVTLYPNLQVIRPGTDTTAPFAALSVSGGIVNALSAYQRALKRYGGQ